MIVNCNNKVTIKSFVEEVTKFTLCLGFEDRARYLFRECISENEEDVEKVFTELKDLKNIFQEDLNFFFESDPAANSTDEILTCYPGFQAIVYHRIAHILYKSGFKLQARMISEDAHSSTGIDIHPGATISHPFFIDHGTGIVIGETAIVGTHCKIYQGVTLGALSLSKGQLLKGNKRHPTIGNHVTIYANASILGGDVNIGDNVIIGGNVYLTKSVPSNYRVIIGEPSLTYISK